MTRVVIDTNVLVSGILKQHGLEASVLNLIATDQLTWCLSEPILEEYRRVLLSKLGFQPAHVQWYFDLAAAGHIVIPSARLKESPDDSDNRFLECAEVAEADYLVTGNKRHFPAQWKNSRIVNARELLEVIQPAEK
jgi:uncharacterized protein